MKPLTDKQQFALRAIEKGAVKIRAERVGWRTVTRFYAWDSEITTQIRSLVRVHKLACYTKEGVALRTKEGVTLR